MATAGSFAYFWEELSASSDVRRERFDRGSCLTFHTNTYPYVSVSHSHGDHIGFSLAEVLRGNKLVPPKAEQLNKQGPSEA